MKQQSDGVADTAVGGGILVGTALVLCTVSCRLPASTRAEIETGTPEEPSSVAAVADTFQRQVPDERYTPIPDAELPQLKPFKATVEQMQPCAAYLKTADGRRIRIGSPGATPEVAGFVAGLQEGRTYDLPEAFLEYRKGQAAEP